MRMSGLRSLLGVLVVAQTLLLTAAPATAERRGYITCVKLDESRSRLYVASAVPSGKAKGGEFEVLEWPSRQSLIKATVPGKLPGFVVPAGESSVLVGSERGIIEISTKDGAMVTSWPAPLNGFLADTVEIRRGLIASIWYDCPTASSTTVSLLEPAKGTWVTRMTCEKRAKAIAAHSLTGTVAVATGEDTVEVLDIETSCLLAQLPVGPTVESLQFSPDGKWLAGRTMSYRLQGSRLLIWDVSNRFACVADTKYGSRSGAVMTFSDDSSLLVTSDGGSDLVGVFRVGEWTKPKEEFSAQHRVFAIEVSSDNRWVITGGMDGCVHTRQIGQE